VAALSDRISKLEQQISSGSLALMAELKESIADHERRLESLDCRISVLEPNLRTDAKELQSPIATPTPVPPVSPPRPLEEAEFPLPDAKSVEGIISYLTRKQGGNVHDEGIVTITSKSVYKDWKPQYAVRNVTDLF
jgi:hypothetical protein